MAENVHEQLIQRFQKEGWPPLVLITGEKSVSKNNFVQNVLTRAIFESLKNKNLDIETLKLRIKENQFPDFYAFSENSVKIGNSDRPEAGTVRDLLQKHLPYAPRETRDRFVYFPAAEAIGNEAESALLKSFEEPPEHTRFILAAENINHLKDTIISRSIQVPFRNKTDETKIPVDPWQRFWFYSGLEGRPVYDLILEKEFDVFLKETYDSLKTDMSDYEIFEDAIYLEPKKLFAKEKQDVLAQIMHIATLPVYFSLRDQLLQKSAIPMGPLALQAQTPHAIMKCMHQIEHFFMMLEKRYFSTRVPHLGSVFFSFLSRFFDFYRLLRA